MFRRPGSGLPIDSQVRRPMMTGWPIVTRLKYARSAGRRHGSRLSRPMTPLRALATTSDLIMSDGDGRLDRRVGIVALQPEILVTERVQVLYLRVELHRGKLAGSARE